jgi:hypothetical protein
MQQSAGVSLYALRHRLDWQAEGEDRSAAYFAGDPDGSSVGFDNRLRDGKAHPRPRDPVPLAFASIELGKDLIDFQFFYSWSLINDMKDDITIFLLGGDRDRLSG